MFGPFTHPYAYPGPTPPIFPCVEVNVLVADPPVPPTLPAFCVQPSPPPPPFACTCVVALQVTVVAPPAVAEAPPFPITIDIEVPTVGVIEGTSIFSPPAPPFPPSAPPPPPPPTARTEILETPYGMVQVSFPVNVFTA